MRSPLEILELKPDGEYFQLRIALNGQLCVPFQVHKSVRETFVRDDDFEKYLERQGQSLLMTYGDAREMRIEPIAALA
jgi:hypothetical protein